MPDCASLRRVRAVSVSGDSHFAGRTSLVEWKGWLCVIEYDLSSAAPPPSPSARVVAAERAAANLANEAASRGMLNFERAGATEALLSNVSVHDACCCATSAAGTVVVVAAFAPPVRRAVAGRDDDDESNDMSECSAASGSKRRAESASALRAKEGAMWTEPSDVRRVATGIVPVHKQQTQRSAVSMRTRLGALKHARLSCTVCAGVLLANSTVLLTRCDQ